MKEQGERLRKALSCSHQLANSLDVPGFPLMSLELLQDWQRSRLARTYADLLNEDRFLAAGHFFLDELYGGLNFRERDQEVERVLPVMVRLLPDRMLLALTRAFELQALCLDLDIDMAGRMFARGWNSLDAGRYGLLYRQTGRARDRDEQVGLIYELGLELNELVHHRLVMRLISLLRVPARVAGFEHLQGFLEDGLQAFQAMRDGTVFIQTIRDRETEIMRRLQAGEERPFDSKKCSRNALPGSVRFPAR